MAARRVTVASLAEEAASDLDVALVTLWDAGLDYLHEPGDTIAGKDVTTARRALDIATARALGTPQYWKDRLGYSDAEFALALDELGIKISPRARRLPKGAVAKLKRLGVRRGHGPTGPRESNQTSADEMMLPPLEWRVVGQRLQQMRYLSHEEVVGIHFCLVEDFAGTTDPIIPAGVRDENLLSSAVARPRTSLGSEDKYPTVQMAAAALMHSVALNHAFHNGNKRTALVSMLVFLDENSFQLTCDEDDMFRVVLLLTQHRLVKRASGDLADREVIELSEWLCKHARRVDLGERVLKWVRFRRILNTFGCSTEFPKGTGNRINIYRPVERWSRLGRQRTEVLSTQVYYAGEGTDVERNTVTKIRRDLELDDEHGCDSSTFYGMEVMPAQDFILTYRKSLARLAKL